MQRRAGTHTGLSSEGLASTSTRRCFAGGWATYRPGWADIGHMLQVADDWAVDVQVRRGRLYASVTFLEEPGPGGAAVPVAGCGGLTEPELEAVLVRYRGLVRDRDRRGAGSVGARPRAGAGVTPEGAYGGAGDEVAPEGFAWI